AGAGTTSVTGTITNAASLTVAGGTVNLTGTGSVDTSGNTIEVTAGTLTNDGDGIANTEAVLISGGTLTTTGADTIASLTQSGGLVNGGAVLTAGTFSQSGGTMAGNVNTITSATLNGMSSITGTLSGGDVTVMGGVASVTSGGQITAASVSIDAGTLRTDGGALSAGVAVSNAGTFVFTGTETIGALSGSGTTNLGATDGLNNVLTLAGGASSVQSHNFVLGSDAAGVGDRLVSDGGNAFAAAATQTFNISLAGDYALGTTYVVVQGQTNIASSLTVNVANQSGGALLYSLVDRNGNTELVVEGNPGIGGIASGVSLTQSIVANVVNRPSSPFASGLAAERGCSQGGYGRAVGGRTKAKGSSIAETAGVVRQNSLTANYYGVQGGYDFICNDGRFFDGWSGGAGALLGYNKGKSNQPVETDRADGLGLRTRSITNSDFDQTYAGFYVVGNKDALTVDGQLRFENTRYTLNETEIVSGSALGLRGDKFTTKGVNFTGRVSYNVIVNDQGLNFVPTAGVSVTRTGASTLTFSGSGFPGARNSLALDAYTSKVGFIGGTLAKSTINEAAASGSTVFVSANYYKEFGGARNARFTSFVQNPDLSISASTENIKSDNLGGFGELSLGWNYIKVLENGPAGARQLNTNLRLDTRFGKNISDSYSLTAQVRLSF
ncbi:MAG: beta strand repeat-containing protein, partial [Gemmobacter sp.]